MVRLLPNDLNKNKQSSHIFLLVWPPVPPIRCFWQEFVLIILIACGYLPLLKDWMEGGQKEIG